MYRVQQQRTPGAHVAGNYGHDGRHVLEKILVANAHSMRFACLKFGVNTIQFDDDGTVTAAEAEFTEPRFHETGDRGGLQTANNHLNDA